MSVVSYLRNADKSKPGQHLLPEGVANFLKTIKIMFGTSDDHDKVDYDPTVALVNHIIECVGALRDVNRVYVGKGSVAAKSIGTRALFGLTSELSSLMLDICTWTPTDFTPPDMVKCYSRVAFQILAVMPEFGEVEPLHPDNPVRCGKLLLHHAITKFSEGSGSVPVNFIEMLINSNPKSLMHKDNDGNIPLHLALQDSLCPLDVLELLLNGDIAEINSLAIPDKFGFLPLHLAVRHSNCTAALTARMIRMYPKAAWTACQMGSIPLHWAAGKDAGPVGISLESVNFQIVKLVFDAFPDGGRTCCDNGWLPLHWCINRSYVDVDVLKFLMDVYPVAVQLPVSDTGQLPLHLLLSQDEPSIEAAQMLLDAYPRSTQIHDDDGYLPLHTALDSAGQDIELVQLLLEVYPRSVQEPTANGWLPLHVALASDGANETVIQRLLNLYPEAAIMTVTDLIELSTLTSVQQRQYRVAQNDAPAAIVLIDDVEYVERKWSPLSKAIERGLKIIVKFIREVIDGGSRANDLSHISISEPQQSSISRGQSPERGFEYDYGQTSDFDRRDIYADSSRRDQQQQDYDHEDRRERRDREYRRFKSAGHVRRKGSKGRMHALRHKNSRDREDFVHRRGRVVNSAPPLRDVRVERKQQLDGDGNEISQCAPKVLVPVKPAVNFALTQNVELLQHQMDRMQMRQHELSLEYQARMSGLQMDSHILRHSMPNAPYPMVDISQLSGLDPHNQSSRVYSQPLNNVGHFVRMPLNYAPVSTPGYHEQHLDPAVIDEIYGVPVTGGGVTGAGGTVPLYQMGDGLNSASVDSLSTGTAGGESHPSGRPPVGPGSLGSRSVVSGSYPAPGPDTGLGTALSDQLYQHSDEHSHMRAYVDAADLLDLGPDVPMVTDNEGDTPRSWGLRGNPLPGDQMQDDQSVSFNGPVL